MATKPAAKPNDKKPATKPAAKPAAKTPAADASREELLALGAEINAIIFPDEPVDYNGMDDDALLAQIISDTDNIEPKDGFNDDSKATIAIIGVTIEWATPADKKDKVTKPAAKDKPAAKAKSAAKTKEPKADKEPRYTRDQAVSAAIRALGKKGFTMETLLEKSDEIAVENGLGSNPSATNVNRYMVIALVDFGILTKTDKTFKLA